MVDILSLFCYNERMNYNSRITRTETPVGNDDPSSETPNLPETNIEAKRQSVASKLVDSMRHWPGLRISTRIAVNATLNFFQAAWVSGRNFLDDIRLNVRKNSYESLSSKREKIGERIGAIANAHFHNGMWDVEYGGVRPYGKRLAGLAKTYKRLNEKVDSANPRLQQSQETVPQRLQDRNARLAGSIEGRADKLTNTRDKVQRGIAQQEVFDFLRATPNESKRSDRIDAKTITGPLGPDQIASLVEISQGRKQLRREERTASREYNVAKKLLDKLMLRRFKLIEIVEAKESEQGATEANIEHNNTLIEKIEAGKTSDDAEAPDMEILPGDCDMQEINDRRAANELLKQRVKKLSLDIADLDKLIDDIDLRIYQAVSDEAEAHKNLLLQQQDFKNRHAQFDIGIRNILLPDASKDEPLSDSKDGSTTTEPSSPTP